MTISHSTGSKAAIADAMGEYVDTGGAGSLKVFDASSNLLVSITLNVDGFVTVGAEAVINGVPNGVAVADGDVSTFKLLNGNGDLVYQGTVTGPGGGGDLEIDGSAAVLSGETVSVTSHRWSIT